MKTAYPNKTEKSNKDTGAMKESLMLPCTSAGKTTSASIAERSNIWAENKLIEKKNVLDQKLYKSIVKMNTNKLEVIHELSKLKKSSSTGALEKMAKDMDDKHAKHGSTNNKSIVKSHSKSSLPLTSERDTHVNHLPHDSDKKGKSETLLKNTDSVAKITITVGGDGSSDELSDDEKSGKNHTHTRTISLTSCALGRECSSSRSELRKFENATKRYARALSAKAKTEK